MAASFERIERVVTEEVVDVDALGRQELVLLAVADRQPEVLVVLRVDDERLRAAALSALERLDQLLGLDLGELEAVDDEEAPLLVELREGARERADAHRRGGS